jgi:hypothetical protein
MAGASIVLGIVMVATVSPYVAGALAIAAIAFWMWTRRP